MNRIERAKNLLRRARDWGLGAALDHEIEDFLAERPAAPTYICSKSNHISDKTPCSACTEMKPAVGPGVTPPRTYACACTWEGLTVLSPCDSHEKWARTGLGDGPIRAGDPVVVVKAGDLAKMRSDIAALKADLCKTANSYTVDQRYGALAADQQDIRASIERTAANIRTEMRDGHSVRDGEKVRMQKRIEALEKSEAARMDPIRRDARLEIIRTLERLGLPDYKSYEILLKKLHELELIR